MKIYSTNFNTFTVLVLIRDAKQNDGEAKQSGAVSEYRSASLMSGNNFMEITISTQWISTLVWLVHYNPLLPGE